LKNDVKVPSKSNMQRNFAKNIIFWLASRLNDENRRIRIRIRIHTKCHGSATLLETLEKRRKDQDMALVDKFVSQSGDKNC
jgi:hypothetical protein